MNEEPANEEPANEKADEFLQKKVQEMSLEELWDLLDELNSPWEDDTCPLCGVGTHVGGTKFVYEDESGIDKIDPDLTSYIYNCKCENIIEKEIVGRKRLENLSERFSR